MRKLLLSLALLPALAAAQGVDRGIVTTSKISTEAPARYVFVQIPGAALTAANSIVSAVYVPWAGRVVDIIVYQAGAGVGGTSYTVDLKTVGGTSLLSTLAVVTLASGVGAVTDARGLVALPAGWTRPVVKTTSDAVVTRGQRLNIHTVETGTYGTHANVMVTVVIDPV